MASSRRRLGLRQVAPPGNSRGDTIVDIVAIHGLATESPRTWEFKKGPGKTVNWLADSDMLPAIVPRARILTYDWDANSFNRAPVETLLGHAKKLLATLSVGRESAGCSRPIVFVASCFGGLILAEALLQAAQEGSPHRQVLLSTTGVAFLATPLRGSDAAAHADWAVVVGGIMGKQSSKELIVQLNKDDRSLLDRTEKFADLVSSTGLRICCFYETLPTELLRRFVSADWARPLSQFLGGSTKRILVAKNSACLDMGEKYGLSATHSGMNKFDGRESHDFQLVSSALKKMTWRAIITVNGRQSVRGRSRDVSSRDMSSRDKKPRSPSERQQGPHFVVPFGRSNDFVGRKHVLQQLIQVISPDADADDCQRTAVEGLGGVGKTRLAIEVAYRMRDTHPNCSVFWVPVLNMTTFENAYRDIGRKLAVSGIGNDKANVKALVKEALGHESAGSWLLIVDNADDQELLFDRTDNAGIANFLPFNQKGSILFTTRTATVVADLDIAVSHHFKLSEMTRADSAYMLATGLRPGLIGDQESTSSLLDTLADLPLAIKQASAYMNRHGIAVAKYLEFCQSSDSDLIELLSRDFEDRARYDKKNNPVATTWLISFKRIMRDSPSAEQCLTFMSCVADKNIPANLLPRERDVKMHEGIGVLKAYSLITEQQGGKSYSIHRLVRLAVRNWLEKEELLEVFTTWAMQQINSVYPSPDHDNKVEWAACLPHAEVVLQNGQGSTDKKTLARLILHVAYTYVSTGRYQESERMYRRHIDLGDTIGRDAVRESRKNLAVVLVLQNKHAEADALEQQTLEEENASDRSSSVTLPGLTIASSEQDSDEEADRRATQRRTSTRAVKHHTPTTMHKLAASFSAQGKFAEAERLDRRVLEFRTRKLGAVHLDTIDSMRRLASTLSAQGKYSEAEELLQTRFAEIKRELGAGHSETLDSMRDSAAALGEQGKHVAAEELSRRAVERRRELFGAEHPSTLRDMEVLSVILDHQGKHEESTGLREQVNSIRAREGEASGPSTLSSGRLLDKIDEGPKKCPE